jgi:hypothetical protein
VPFCGNFFSAGVRHSWRAIVTPWREIVTPWREIATPWSEIAAPWNETATPWRETTTPRRERLTPWSKSQIPRNESVTNRNQRFISRNEPLTPTNLNELGRKTANSAEMTCSWWPIAFIPMFVVAFARAITYLAHLNGFGSPEGSKIVAGGRRPPEHDPIDLPHPEKGVPPIFPAGSLAPLRVPTIEGSLPVVCGPPATI